MNKLYFSHGWVGVLVAAGVYFVTWGLLEMEVLPVVLFWFGAALTVVGMIGIMLGSRHDVEDEE